MIDYQMSLFETWPPEQLTLKGKRIAITGKLALPRAAVIDLIAAVGGIYATTVSSHTDYLIIGAFAKGRTTSRKLAAAMTLGVKTLNPITIYYNLNLL